MLGRCGVEQCGVDASFDVARQQRVEDLGRVRLELEVGAGAVLAVAARHRRRPLERHERPQDDFLAAGGDEAGVDELDLVDLAGDEQIDDVLADAACVFVAWADR